MDILNNKPKNKIGDEMDIIKTILTAVLSVAELFILTKIMGRRQISQLSFFDYIVGITIGSIAAEMAFADFNKSWKHAIALLVYALLAALFSFLGNKSIHFRRAFEGETLILLNNGKMYRDNFRKSKLDINEFLTQSRINGYFSLDEVQTAIIEPNGHITFLPKAEKKPLCAEDLNIEVNPSSVPFVVISDGKILKDNLEGCGKNEIWLRKELEEKQYPSPHKIFLAMCDGNNLTVFKTDNVSKSRDIYN